MQGQMRVAAACAVLWWGAAVGAQPASSAAGARPTADSSGARARGGAVRDSLAPAAPFADACVAFSFGAWSPPLDLRAAGHSPASAEQAAAVLAQRGQPRGAAITDPAGRDSTLVLFPGWWPAGVSVRLSAAAGDTLAGTAVAHVANGTANPTARVRAWRVACRNR